MNGLTRREVLDRFDAIVAFAEVEKVIDSPVRTYSTGMLMRLAFATAAYEPEILLIDEVLSVGDLAFAQVSRPHCRDLETRLFHSLVSHESSVIQDMCDEAIWITKGRLMAQGAPQMSFGSMSNTWRTAGRGS